MARTQKGIYYNDDYNSAADILEDERLMAESIDDAIGDSKTDVETQLANKVDKVAGKGLSTNDFTAEYKQKVDDNTQDISDLQDEQAEQNTDIEALQGQVDTLETQVADLEEQVSDLENNQLTGTSTGQSIYIEDSTNTKVRSIGLSGNSEQESTTGYNIFPSAKAGKQTSGGITIECDGKGTYKVNGTSTVAVSLIFELEEEVTFPVSVDKGGNGKLYLGNSFENSTSEIIFCDENKYNIDNWILSPVNRTNTFYSALGGKVCKYIKFNIKANETINGTVKPMFTNEGDTTREFEPYTGGQASPNPNYPQEIHCTGDNGSVNEKVQNGNLFDENVILNAPNWVYTNKYYTGNLSELRNYFLANPIFSNFKENTQYAFSWKGYLGSGTNARIRFIYTDSSYSEGANINSSSQMSANVVSTANKTIDHIVINYGSNGVLFIKEIQLEEGSATSYVPHEEQNISIPTQQPMRAIGEYKDTFVKVDGNWYERHYIGRLILTGEEDIEGGNVDGGTTGVSKRFYITHNLTNLTPAITSDGLMCSSFVVGSTYGNDDTLIQLSSTLIFLRINVNDYSNLTTKNELKAWLAQRYANENPVYIDYILATPLDLPCTEEQVQALEDLEKARTYKPVTHISSTDEVPATVDITYVRDLETVINNISSAVVALGGEVNV